MVMISIRESRMDEQDLEKLERDVMKARQEKVCALQQMKSIVHRYLYNSSSIVVYLK